MTKLFFVFVLIFFGLSTTISAQDEPIIEEEEGEEVIDFSNLVQTAENKAYCSSKIVGQLPVKLFSIGYDYQAGHPFEPGSFSPSGSAAPNDIENTRGLRLGINYPVISKNSFVLNLGFNYMESNYVFSNAATGMDNPLTQALDNNGLRSTGFTATAFKPINSRKFLIFQFGATLNGDYTFSDFQPIRYTRYSGAAIYGIKPNDRKMWGFGVSRTYLGGSLNYLPVYYMLYTAPSKKWGLELLLPARFNYRRNINAKNMLLAGWEIEGNTYRIQNDENQYNLPFNDIELRRSELRLRMAWEHALSPQFWFNVQAGYRYNWSFDADRGDFFRPFGDDTPFLAENILGNTAYVNFSISWVSP